MTHGASHFTDKVNELARHNENYTMLSDFQFLPPAEQALLGIWELHAEVYNGGFFQYMTNGSGEHALATCQILKEIGADRTSSMVARAAELVGPELRSMDYFSARDALSQENKDELRTLDGELYSQEEHVNTLLYRYLLKHRDELDVPEGFWAEATAQ
jgi:hypothetical protein